jgi:hypothetical protein
MGSIIRDLSPAIASKRRFVSVCVTVFFGLYLHEIGGFQLLAGAGDNGVGVRGRRASFCVVSHPDADWEFRAHMGNTCISA